MRQTFLTLPMDIQIYIYYNHLNVIDRARVYMALPKELRDAFTSPYEEKQWGTFFKAVIDNKVNTLSSTTRKLIELQWQNDPTIKEASVNIPEIERIHKIHNLPIESLTYDELMYIMNTLKPNDFKKIESHPVFTNAMVQGDIFGPSLLFYNIVYNCMATNPELVLHMSSKYDLSTMKHLLKYFTYSVDTLETLLQAFVDLNKNELDEIYAVCIDNLHIDSAELVRNKVKNLD